MKALKFLLIIYFLLAHSLFSQDLGNIPAAFVDIGMGARPVALGGAYVGLANDVNCLFCNPSGLVGLESNEASFSYAKIFDLITYNAISYAMPITKGLDGAGLALISSGDKALSEMTILGGYARKVGDFSLGINLKYRIASFGDNSIDDADMIVFEPDEIALGRLNQVKGKGNGFGIDVGAMYRLTPKVQFGLMIRDLFSPVSWDSRVDNPDAKTKGNYSENIPMETTIGSSFNVFENMIVTADYSPSFAKDVSNKIRGGTEIRLFKIIFLRAGIQNFINTEDDEKYIFGFGMNVKISSMRVSFDYTHLIEQFANSNRLTVGLTF